MFGNVTAERAAIETMYEDIADISRAKPQTDENGITKTVNTVIYSGISCALSYTGSDNSGQNAAQNEIEYDAVIYASPDLDVQAGDVVKLTRFGRDNPNSSRVLTFDVVGRPNVYATHQEIHVREGDIA